MALKYIGDKNVANELQFLRIWRLYDFRGVYCL